jgi:hypothetical protein
MNSLIVTLVFTAFSYSSVQAALCGPSNPCGLDTYYTPARGYHCIQKDASTAVCTCPGGLEENMPCRLCARRSSVNNVCRNTTGKLIACLDSDFYGASYACLCSNGFGVAPVLTTDADCDTLPFVTLTTPPTTTTVSSGTLSPCLNGGVFSNGFCYCPSGYSGTLCGNKNDLDLCDRVYCVNNGTCAIPNDEGPYEGVCLCRYGTYGEYCELRGTLGFCSAGSCLNGGACKENVIGVTRFAYCYCPAGYNGPKCENRYFICPAVGKFPDLTLFAQGKYFDCTSVGGTIQIQQKSCPRGLRFNANANICTY